MSKDFEPMEGGEVIGWIILAAAVLSALGIWKLVEIAAWILRHL